MECFYFGGKMNYVHYLINLMEKIIKYPHLNFRDKTGEIFITNEGYTIKIIECFGSENCTIQFENSFIIKNRTYGNIVKGRVKNPYHPSVCGIGYIGEGKHTCKENGKLTKSYKTWQNMLKRCYDKKELERHPTYKGCFVEESWHNFQVFAEWFTNNYIDGQALDKDILLKMNKVYSSETSCFVPYEINKLFVKGNKIRGELPIGVSKLRNKFQSGLTINGKRVHLGHFNTPEEAFQAYKTAKEDYIKEMANKWKDQITEETYQAMYNYKVEITD